MVAREHGVVYLMSVSARRMWNEVAHGEEHVFYFDRQNLSNENDEYPRTEGLETERYRKRADVPLESINDLKWFIRKKYMGERICQYYLERLLDVFNYGGEIAVGKLDGKIVGYIWKIHGDANYHRYFNLLPLVPRDGVLIGGHVLPMYRGRGIFPTLMRYAGLLLVEEGAERIFGTCKEWNHSSRRGILKSGMRYLCTARSIGILGKRFIIRSRKKGIDQRESKTRFKSK